MRIERASAQTMAEEMAARTEVVGEERLGRGAAEAVHGGVVPAGALGGLGELAKEADHVGREGSGGLGGEQVHDVALR